MRIGILGPLEVCGADGRPVRVTAAGPRLLLHRLAIEPGRVINTGTLVTDLWASALPADPAGALQSVVARLRRALDADSDTGRAAIASHPAGYALDLPPTAVDAEHFQRLATEGRTALHAGQPEHAVELLRDALALWRGTPLADAADAVFALAPAARLTELHRAAVLDRIEAELALGQAELAELEQLCAADPVGERPAALLIRALLHTGARADALRAYTRIRSALAEELGVDPGPELRELHLTALREQPAPSPATGRLPARWTSFVGRETETTHLRTLLATHRLVTLTGFGGVGKTRLAIEAADGLCASQPDGVWLVEFAAITDPAGLAPAVLTALGRSGQAPLAQLAGRPQPDDPVEQLADWLAGRRLLLIFDNCEHLVEPVAVLADRLLAASAGLRVLATSREPLGITGEVRVPVSPLDLPDPAASPSQIAHSPAVALFADRAALVRPGFAVHADTSADVLRVCRALDGIPLAIELAAARLGSLTPAQLAERIDARFALLDRGSRTAPDRHRTLRAALDWSWELLAEPDRILLRRLAVFRDGADVAAIGRLCVADADPAEVVDRLSGLVDRSLVVLTESAFGARYRLLAILREYAEQRLTEAGEADRLRTAHARYFAELAREAEPRLRTAEQLTWLARLDAEDGNLAAAMGYACTAPLPAVAVELVAASMWRWGIRGQRAQARHWAAEAVRAVGQHPSPVTDTGAYQLCLLTAHGLPGVPAEPEVPSLAGFLRRWPWPAALVVNTIGQWPTSVALAELRETMAEIAELLVEQPDPWLRAVGELGLGTIDAEFTPGGAPAAQRHLRTALAGFDRIGDRWGLLYAEYELSSVLESLGADAAAVSALDRARAHAEALGGADALPVPRILLIRSGELRARAGDRAGATAELTMARAVAEASGDRISLARVLRAEGELARFGGDLAGAERAHAAAVALVNELTGQFGPADGLSSQFVALAHSDLARVRGLRGDQASAHELHGTALALISQTIDAPVQASVLENLAEWGADQGHGQPAARALGAAMALRGTEPDSATPIQRALLARCDTLLGVAGCRAALAVGRTLPATAITLPD